jgi:hypothetical protein
MELTNLHGIDESLFGVMQKLSKRKPRQERFSATAVIDSPRIRQLTIRHWDTLEQDVAEMAWLLLGLAVHGFLEKHGNIEDLVEEKIEQKFEGDLIVGVADLYNLANKTVKDWKVTSAWTKVFNPRGRIDWFYQGNLYKWLYEVQGFDVDRVKFCMIYRDWSKSKLRNAGNDYPKIPFGEISYVKDGTKTHMHSLLDKEDIEEYLRGRMKLHKVAAELKDGELPVCTPDEKWQNPAKFAVMKGKNKTAAKVENTLDEARVWARAKIASDPKLADLLYIVERPQSSMRCADYCPVRFICEYREVPDEERILTVEG